MIKKITLLMGLLFSMVLMSMGQRNVEISTETGEMFEVYFDNVKMSVDAKLKHVIKDVERQSVHVKLVFANKAIPTVETNISLKDNRVCFFEVKQNSSGKYVVRFSSDEDIVDSNAAVSSALTGTEGTPASVGDTSVEEPDAKCEVEIFTNLSVKYDVYFDGKRVSRTSALKHEFTDVDEESFSVRVVLRDRFKTEVNTSFTPNPGKKVIYELKQNSSGKYVVRFSSEKDIVTSDAADPSSLIGSEEVTPVNDGDTSIEEPKLKCEIEIFTNLSVKYDVYFDGKRVSRTSALRHEFTDVDEESFSVRVVLRDRFKTEVNTSFTPNPGKKVIYELKQNSSGKYVVRFLSEVDLKEDSNGQSGSALTGDGGSCRISAAVYAQAKKDIALQEIDPLKLKAAKVLVDKYCLTAEQIKGVMQLFLYENARLEFAKQAYVKCSDRNNYKVINSVFDSYASVIELEKYIVSFSSEENSNGQSGNALTGDGGSCRISAALYDQAKKDIALQEIDPLKLKEAKVLIDKYCLTADQIKGVMQIFGHDKARLAFAKYAYVKCSDKNNYKVINSVFDSYASVIELEKYIELNK